MANIIIPPGWQSKDSESTSRSAYDSRRTFIKTLGLGSIGVIGGWSYACSDEDRIREVVRVADRPDGPLGTIPQDAPRAGLPADRNTLYKVGEREISDRIAASSYNNFYEFDGSSKEIWHLTDEYDPFPTVLKVRGEVEEEFEIDVFELIESMAIEERLYRFRCVEAWSLTVPWSGFPLAKLIERCRPTSKAEFVRFVSISDKKQMPGVANQPWYKWPYYEALRIDEAMNPVAFMATGMYGEPLPKQNGSPMRVVLPWKYGYKGAKAVREIEFTRRQPKTFWNDLAPSEYSFLSNINPNVPHPRWSQASERFISSLESVRRIPTTMFNGYGEWVGSMYPDEPRS
ncbi:MAG: protein-methionine-sulfoxide reductase catalytic subunit MsrP [Rhodothermales bacterium]|nr:protein-methionine-sulfoxide reductase catalytic subunit MsrP [Rhodothermales bacterium]